ncbi:cytochrome-c peroxidase [Candidatus Entotheonella palauensis]|uniref:cytochrome-c peroxidase n=1 Tax=Candidatus Entotheonella palauensis TaxID=93172 RepID=UPI000B7DE738|nr:cytochrome c peroxidase [Candidatus Entotheonella palauensis]
MFDCTRALLGRYLTYVAFALLMVIALPDIQISACHPAKPHVQAPTQPAMACMHPASQDTADRLQIEPELRPLPSQQGRFRLHIKPATDSIRLHDLHAWVVHIESASGAPIQPKRLLFGGGMPQHGHGFPSQPAITRYLGDGDWLIEGVQFNMTGQWQMHFELLDETGWDRSTFEFTLTHALSQNSPQWSESELAVLKSLWIGALPPIRSVAGNPVALVSEAAAFGHHLFFDPHLSANGQVSCASCHDPARYFSDGRQRAQGLGEADRHTPSLAGVAHHHWFFWDGRRESLWSQALVPIEAAHEMGSTRLETIRYIAQQPAYRLAYQHLFGALPDAAVFESLPDRASPIGDAVAQTAWSKLPLRLKRQLNTAFANVGRVMSAYEHQLQPGPGRFDHYFDHYVEAVLNGRSQAASALLSDNEIAGLKLFISGRTRCLTCHNGPLMTNRGFHNIGTGNFDSKTPDFGRMLGLQAVLMTEFNCRGRYSGRKSARCDKMQFMNRTEIQGMMRGAFKVPSLRNTAATAPYMHDGSFATLHDVMQHYRKPPAANRQAMHELTPLELTDQEVEQLVAFLHTLTGDMATDPQWLRPPADHNPSWTSNANGESSKATIASEK